MMKNTNPLIIARVRHERGAVSLLIVLIFILIAAIVALSLSRTVSVDQKITGNDLRAREAQEAAQAGLEYGIAFANQTAITASLSCPGGAGCPTLDNITGTSTGNSYSITSLNFTVPAGDDRIHIQSTATHSDGTSAYAEVWVRQKSLLEKGTFPPPLVVNGGLSNVTGNPAINTGNPPGTAIVTNSAVTGIDTGFFNKKGSDPPLGSVQQQTLPATTTWAWDYVFSESLANAEAKAQASGYVYSQTTLPTVPEVGKSQYYLWDSSNHISNNYGSATRPVVIIVTAGNCPNIQGNVTIYGIIYFPATCTDQGWGNATIYGSVVTEGSITKLTANSTHNGLNGGGGGPPIIFLDYAAVIPGTWKDW
jgi:Tfp pilus assembly protein PilX